MISGHVVLVVPGGLQLNMALAAPCMKMCPTLSPTACSRDNHGFRFNSFITKCCTVEAETLHAWWLRRDGLLPRQGRTSCRGLQEHGAGNSRGAFCFSETLLISETAPNTSFITALLPTIWKILFFSSSPL